MPQSINDWLVTAFEFHGHQCPALVLGLRSGLAAMKALGVERSSDQELYLISETGDGHARGCFVDGLMVATGCTYGKSNITKTSYDKFAFTLIDTIKNRAVRAHLLAENVEVMMQSRFAKKRIAGKSPVEIASELKGPLMASVLGKAERNFIEIRPVTDWKSEQVPRVYETSRCDECGELTFVSKLTRKDGRNLCPCCFQAFSGENN